MFLNDIQILNVVEFFYCYIPYKEVEALHKIKKVFLNVGTRSGKMFTAKAVWKLFYKVNKIYNFCYVYAVRWNLKRSVFNCEIKYATLADV